MTKRRTAWLIGSAAAFLTLYPVRTMSNADPPEFDPLWDYNEPARTRERFQELREAHPDAPKPYLLELQTQIARTYGLEQKFDSAHAVLDSIEPSLENSPTRVQVRYLLERGRTFNSSGHPAEARLLFEQAWEVARDAKLDALAVDAAHMVAIAAPAEVKLTWNERALELARASEDPAARRWQGSLFNNIGWTYFAREDYDRALEYFEEALSCRRAQGQVEEVRIARWCVAKCLRYLDRVDESLAMQEELLEEHSRDGTPDGYVHEELAECLALLGRTDEAAPHYYRAWELLHTDIWLAKNEPQRLERLKRLGEGR